jgi:hypothetical protein
VKVRDAASVAGDILVRGTVGRMDILKYAMMRVARK